MVHMYIYMSLLAAASLFPFSTVKQQNQQEAVPISLKREYFVIHAADVSINGKHFSIFSELQAESPPPVHIILPLDIVVMSYKNVKDMLTEKSLTRSCIEFPCHIWSVRDGESKEDFSGERIIYLYGKYMQFKFVQNVLIFQCNMLLQMTAVSMLNTMWLGMA